MKTKLILGKSVNKLVCDSVDVSVRNSVWIQINTSMIWETKNIKKKIIFGESVSNSLNNSVRESVSNSVWDLTWKYVNNSLWNLVRDSISNSTRWEIEL